MFNSLEEEMEHSRADFVASQPLPFVTSPLWLNSEGEEEHFSDSDDEMSDDCYYFDDNVVSD